MFNFSFKSKFDSFCTREHVYRVLDMNRNVVKKEKESKGTNSNCLRDKIMLLRTKSWSKFTSVNYISEPNALGYFSS